MIFRFFACNDCKIYIDAGGRWAYWGLEEPKVLVRNESIDIQAVLAANSYWNPPNDKNSDWLYEEVFPSLLKFLRDHSRHNVVFVDKDYFPPTDDEHYYDWMQIGYANLPTPRYLIEELGLRNWEQVREYIEKLSIPPVWWEVMPNDPSPRELARRKFEELFKSQPSTLDLEKFKMTFDDVLLAICRRPRMYLMNGTFGEVLSFLDGYGIGSGGRKQGSGSFFSPFAEWLKEKLNLNVQDLWKAFREKHVNDEQAISEFARLWIAYQVDCESTSKNH